MFPFVSVLPVQCLCEFLSAGGAGGAEAGKAGELCAHLRRTLHSEEGARAVLHYYLQRLAHAHAPTRASANRVRNNYYNGNVICFLFVHTRS